MMKWRANNRQIVMGDLDVFRDFCFKVVIGCSSLAVSLHQGVFMMKNFILKLELLETNTIIKSDN